MILLHRQNGLYTFKVALMSNLLDITLVNNNTHQDTEDNLTDDKLTSFGLPSLKLLRQNKNETIELVAQHLRLSPAQIRALEANDCNSLPNAAYVRGFLRNYTRYLNVDAAPYIAQFELALYQNKIKYSQSSSITKNSISHTHTDYSLNKEGDTLPLLSNLGGNSSPITSFEESSLSISFYIKMAVLFIMLTLAFLMFWERALWFHEFKTMLIHIPILNKLGTDVSHSNIITHSAISKNIIISELRPVQPNIAINNQLTKNYNDIKMGTQMPTTSAMRTLKFSLIDTSWIKVSNFNKEVLFSGEQQAGTIQTVVGHSPLKVIIGAADKVKLTVDDIPYDLSSSIKSGVASISIP
jgi:cytoskeleton protein RodZ